MHHNKCVRMPIWLNLETEFLSGHLIWPFQKKNQICPDLLLAVFNFLNKIPPDWYQGSPIIARVLLSLPVIKIATVMITDFTVSQLGSCEKSLIIHGDANDQNSKSCGEWHLLQ
jgi:hypothetical protein